MKGRNVLGGVYVLRFSHKTVKIGMSNNIERRLKQYRGYHRYGKDYPRLMIIKSKYPKQLETLIHKTVSKKYERLGRLEIFVCTDQPKITKLIKKSIQTDRRLVHLICE